MSDIVERLRCVPADECGLADPGRCDEPMSGRPCLCAVVTEAADEIERLRAEVERVKACARRVAYHAQAMAALAAWPVVAQKLPEDGTP